MNYIVRITHYGVFYDTMPTTQLIAEQTAQQLRDENPHLNIQIVEI
jgi:hypothetical protein